MNMIIIEKLFLVMIAILGAGYFCAIETALLSLAGTSLSILKERFPSKATYFLIWEERPHYLLATIVVGTNAFNMASSVLATSLSFDLIKFPGMSGFIGVLTPAMVIVSVLFFAEIIPKVYARRNPERIATLGMKLLAVSARYITPLSVLLVEISEMILKKLGFYGLKESAFLSKDELKIILGSENGMSSDLTKKDRTILTNILTFGERRIKEAMIPRSEIFAVNYSSGLDEILSKAVSSRYSRIPVYKATLDNVIGIIYTKDLVVMRDKTLFVLDDLLRPVYFVPESAPVSKVLRELKTGRHHLSIVVDEYGVTSGIVTVEDLVEEIVGEIYDEYDIHEKKIIEVTDGWIIKGNESISSINSELHLRIPEIESYSTVAGWVLFLFGKIPAPGEKIQYRDLKIEVVESDRKKVMSIKITKEGRKVEG